jgi:hypothetical protein
MCRRVSVNTDGLSVSMATRDVLIAIGTPESVARLKPSPRQQRLAFKQLPNVAGVFGPHVDCVVNGHIWVVPRHNSISVDAEALIWRVNDEHHIATVEDDVPKLLRDKIRFALSNEHRPAT